MRNKKQRPAYMQAGWDRYKELVVDVVPLNAADANMVLESQWAAFLAGALYSWNLVAKEILNPPRTVAEYKAAHQFVADMQAEIGMFEKTLAEYHDGMAMQPPDGGLN